MVQLSAELIEICNDGLQASIKTISCSQKRLTELQQHAPDCLKLRWQMLSRHFIGLTWYQETLKIFRHCCEVDLSTSLYLGRQYLGSSNGWHRKSMTQRSDQSMDEVPTSNRPVGAQHISRAPRDDSVRDLTSLKARTLQPIPISTPVSRDDLQRVPAASNDQARVTIPSSKQPDQRQSRSYDIRNLLNPVEGENHSNESSAVGSSSLSELSIGLLAPSRSHVHGLPSTRSSPYDQVQKASSSQAEDRKHPRTVNPEPQQPASRRANSSTQYSSYSQVSQTESAIASAIVTTGQPQYFPSNPSSGPSSTIVQMPPSVNAHEVPTSSTAVQSQHRLMIVEIEGGSFQVPVDVRAASKIADEKRRRNASAARDSRQRQKDRVQELSENMAKLEAQVRETEEERDYYRTERDHFRDLALRHQLPVAPRPPTPKHQRYAVMDEISLVQSQEVEGDGQIGGHTRRIPRVPSQGLLPSAVWPPLQVPTFQCIN